MRTGNFYSRLIIDFTALPFCFAVWRRQLRWLSNFLYDVHVPCGRGLVLFWWRCDTLCTSGFVDDVMFSYSIFPYLHFPTLHTRTLTFRTCFFHPCIAVGYLNFPYLYFPPVHILPLCRPTSLFHTCIFQYLQFQRPLKFCPFLRSWQTMDSFQNIWKPICFNLF